MGMRLFARPPRRRFADLIRALTEVREHALTAAANTAHLIRSLDELKEHVMTAPERQGQDENVDDNRNTEPAGPQPTEPDNGTDGGRR